MGLEYLLYVSCMSLAFPPCSTSALPADIQEEKESLEVLVLQLQFNQFISSVPPWPTKITTLLEKFQSKWACVSFYVNHLLTCEGILTGQTTGTYVFTTSLKF